MDLYVPSPEEKEDPALYARNVQQYMAEKGGLRMTHHTYEDVVLMEQAVKAKYPTTKLDFTAQRLEELLQVRVVILHL